MDVWVGKGKTMEWGLRAQNNEVGGVWESRRDAFSIEVGSGCPATYTYSLILHYAT